MNRIEYDANYFSQKQRQLFQINSTLANMLSEHIDQLYSRISSIQY